MAWYVGAHICYSDNGWMNEDMTVKWLKKCCGGTYEDCRLLSWDIFKAHGTNKVKEEAKLKKDLVFVPGGCTGILQAC